MNEILISKNQKEKLRQIETPADLAASRGVYVFNLPLFNFEVKLVVEK